MSLIPPSFATVLVSFKDSPSPKCSRSTRSSSSALPAFRVRQIALLSLHDPGRRAGSLRLIPCQTSIPTYTWPSPERLRTSPSRQTISTSWSACEVWQISWSQNRTAAPSEKEGAVSASLPDHQNTLQVVPGGFVNIHKKASSLRRVYAQVSVF